MIIPALDILNERVVRLYQGDYNQAQFYPFTVAQRLAEYQAQGAEKVHLVDLAGARDPGKRQWTMLADAVKALQIPFQIGGGIRSQADVEMWLELGAAQVVVGSTAVAEPELVSRWARNFGAERLVIALDVRQQGEHWRPATHGWLQASEQDLFSLVDFYLSAGVRDFLCTDISKDGTLQGPSLPLYQQLRERCPTAKVQASGGVANLNDIRQLAQLEMAGVILGRALLNGNFNTAEAIACWQNG